MNKDMKFANAANGKGVHIPCAALTLSGFKPGDSIEYNALDGAVVALRKQMTAMELVTAAHGLMNVASSLLSGLAECCGICEGCDEDCRYLDDDFGYVSVPEELRAQADIPVGAKLDATPLKDSNAILLTEAAHRYDLSDVPPVILEIFANTGVCLEALEEHLMEEDVIYGS